MIQDIKNVEKFSYDDLKAFLAAVPTMQERLASIQEEERAKLHEQWEKAANAIGMTVAEVVNGHTRKRRKKSRRRFGLFRRKEQAPPPLPAEPLDALPQQA